MSISERIFMKLSVLYNPLTAKLVLFDRQQVNSGVPTSKNEDKKHVFLMSKLALSLQGCGLNLNQEFSILNESVGYDINTWTTNIAHLKHNHNK